jgi:hypothetical protein
MNISDLNFTHKLQKMLSSGDGMKDECAEGIFDTDKFWLYWMFLGIHVLQIAIEQKVLRNPKNDWSTYRRNFLICGGLFLLMNIAAAVVSLSILFDKPECHSLLRLYAMTEVVLMIIKIPNIMLERKLSDAKIIQIAQHVIN